MILKPKHASVSSVPVLYYLLELHDTKTCTGISFTVSWLYYLLELHDTKTLIGNWSEMSTLYYLLELHDTKTIIRTSSKYSTLYYLLELHDTKTSNSCSLASNDRKTIILKVLSHTGHYQYLISIHNHL